jgi:OPA family glycerol-3-phosphate transporter-like MFS transporter
LAAAVDFNEAGCKLQGVPASGVVGYFMHEQPKPFPGAVRAYAYLGTLVAAYIGVYLCRKNLAVAVPVLQKAWGLSKEQIGIVGSASTVAYAGGKFLFGPITDRLGGRTALLASMSLVAVFGIAGAFSPSLAALVVLYSANRLSGSASWGAMLKLVPEWFASDKLAFACGLLSLSFVFGGALAVSFAGLVAGWTKDSWPAILGAPSIVLLVLVAASWMILPRTTSTAGVTTSRDEPEKLRADESSIVRRIFELFGERRFVVVVALSFALTLLRETFNFWTVDFIRTEAGAQVSNQMAAFLATPFDLCGALGIVLMGWVFGRLRPRGRQRLLVAMLGLLALILALLPELFHLGHWLLAAGVGIIGFLVYGPYSLLGGVLSVEVRGKEYAATVSGLVDGTGYIAGFLSGIVFGKLLMVGGYRLGFETMSLLTLVSALLCFFLYGKAEMPAAAPAEALGASAPAVTDGK